MISFFLFWVVFFPPKQNLFYVHGYAYAWLYVCSTTVQGPMKATKKPSHLLELELQSVVSWWLYGWAPGTELWKKMLLPAELSLQRLWIGFYPKMNLSVLKIQCFFFFFVWVLSIRMYILKDLTNFSESKIHLINNNVLNVLLFTWKYFFSANDTMPNNGWSLNFSEIYFSVPS